jgi:glycosyltransferase involved in cell wall biosynthesis
VRKLSVTVITKNEAADIAEALESAAWADEIVVVDSASDDDTVAIARRYTDRVIVREWPGYSAQKNFAAAAASHDWILSLDADERITPALADEIRATLAAAPAEAGYRVPRVAWHLARWIRTTDWYPDYQLRLYDRRSGQWTGRYVHESVTVAGRVGELHGELQHFAYRDIADHLETIDRYTTLAARQMHEGGRRAGLLQIGGHPPLAFARNYLLRGGIRDGIPGFIISALNAYYVFLKFAKLWELQKVPGSGFKVQGSVQGSRFEVHECGIPNPEPGTPNPEPRTPNPEPGTPNPEPGTEPRTRNSEPRT